MHFLAFSRSSRWPSCRRFLISPRHVECAKRATPSITPHMLRRKIDPAMSPMDMRRLIYLSFWKNAVCARISKVTLLRFHSPYAPRQDSKLYTSLTSLLQMYNVSDQVIFMSLPDWGAFKEIQIHRIILNVILKVLKWISPQWYIIVAHKNDLEWPNHGKDTSLSLYLFKKCQYVWHANRKSCQNVTLLPWQQPSVHYQH